MSLVDDNTELVIKRLRSRGMTRETWCALTRADEFDQDDSAIAYARWLAKRDGKRIPAKCGATAIRSSDTIYAVKFFTGKQSSATAHRHLEIGKAAEHIVCADLILQGHRAYLVDQGAPYDVVFDHNGRLFRVQVKSTLCPRPTPNRPGSGLSYMFGIRRAGKGAKRVIGNNEFDILALVALDIRVVAYIPIGAWVRQTIHLRPPNTKSNHANKRNSNIDEYPVSLLLTEYFE